MKKESKEKSWLQRFFDRLKTDSVFAKKVFYRILIIIIVLPWLILAGIYFVNLFFEWLGGFFAGTSKSCMAKILQGEKTLFNLGKDGISTWFAFWGSYAGAIITYLLTAFTIRLNFVSENRAEKESLDQLAFQLDQLEIEKVCLCNLEENYPIRELELFHTSVGYKYLVKIVFKNPYPVYFGLSDEKKIAFGTEKTGYDAGEVLPSCHINGEHFEILYLIPENSGIYKNIHKFYYINYYEQSVMSVQERMKHLGITFQFENTLYDDEVKEKNRYKLSVDIKLENKDTYQKQWVEWNVLDRMIEGKKEK